MTETRTVSATGGEKGVKDAQIAWADPQSLMELAKVYGYGASKYAPTNYRKGYEWSKSYSAMQRHLHEFWGGADLDSESGLPHVAHAAWHCLTLLTFMREHREYDDRYHGDARLPADVAEAVVSRIESNKRLIEANEKAWRDQWK